MIGVDYATPSLYTPAQLRAAGVSAVGRYLSGPYAIGPAELEGYVSAGLVVWFFFERDSTDAQGGANAGTAYASEVNAALGALGLPTSQPVYFSADEELSDPSSAVPYWQGIAAVRPPSSNGCYGEGALCALLLSEGLVAYTCQSESTSFPGNATTLPTTNIQQVAQGSPLPGTDLDEILTADFGQYPRPVLPHPPTEEDSVSIAIDAQGHVHIAAVGAGPSNTAHLLHFESGVAGAPGGWSVTDVTDTLSAAGDTGYDVSGA